MSRFESKHSVNRAKWLAKRPQGLSDDLDMTESNVLEIVVQFLTQRGYDGLYTDGCWCRYNWDDEEFKVTCVGLKVPTDCIPGDWDEERHAIVPRYPNKK